MARLGLLTRGVVALFQLVMSFQLHPDPLAKYYTIDDIKTGFFDKKGLQVIVKKS